MIVTVRREASYDAESGKGIHVALLLPGIQKQFDFLSLAKTTLPATATRSPSFNPCDNDDRVLPDAANTDLRR